MVDLIFKVTINPAPVDIDDFGEFIKDNLADILTGTGDSPVTVEYHGVKQ